MRIYFVAALVVCFSTALAQNPPFRLKWGKEFDAARNSSLSDIVAYDGTGIYAVKVKTRSSLFGRSSYTLDHYDAATLSPTKSLDLDIEEDGRECDIEEFLFLNKRLFVFFSYENTKTKKNILWVDEIDKESLQPMKNKKKVGEIDYTGNSKRNSGGFKVKLSRDSSKVMIYYNLPYAKGEPEAFAFTVLDDDLLQIWDKKVTIPYKDGLFDIENVRVDDEGNTYLIGLLFKDKRKFKRGGDPNYSYEVFSFTEKGNNMKQYSISLPDKFITDMQMEIVNNNLVCAGFYSKVGTFSIRGTYFLTVDAATRKTKTTNFKEFGIDFIAQNLTERQEKKARKKEEKGKDPELYSYALDNLLIGKDGSAMLIGEQYYVRAVTSTSFINGRSSTSTNYHYYYNDIIAIRIDSSGQIQWAEKIAKTQHTVNDNGFYSSYALGIVRGKICFIFNDNPDNLDYDGKGRPENYQIRKSLVVIVSLDGSGKQTKQPIFSSVDAEVTVRPKVCEQISRNELILFGQRKRNQQFARLVFE